MKMFVTGGARSGKSAFALGVAESVDKKKYFIATAEALDEEMENRIEKHRSERSSDWITLEEPIAISKTMDELDLHGNLLLIDCLGLWTSNMMMDKNINVEQASLVLIEGITKFSGDIILVSNEVGLGIVPDNLISREFRDNLGRLNRLAASACSEAVLMVCGIPLWLKGGPGAGPLER